MPKLLLVFFLLISSSVYSQDIEETLQWLKENTGKTIRDGKLQYECEFSFNERGVRIIGGPNASFLTWDKIQGLATTAKDKVYLAFAGISYGGNEESYFEYVTPKDGISAQAVLNRIAVLCKNADNNHIKYWTFLLGDSDDSYHRIVEEARRRKEENPNDLTEAELAKQKETLEAFDAISFIFGDFYEVSGSASFTNPITYESIFNNKPNTQYELNDVRFSIVYGNKKVALNLGYGVSWMSLPSYRKYDKLGRETAYTDFGTVQFLSPSIGLSYKFMSKENKADFYRSAEFPVNVSFAPLLGAKSKKIKMNNDIFDTPFKDYFEGLSYNINASLGANLFIGKGFGIGISGGGTYVNIKGTTEKIVETVNDRQSAYTIKMDDLQKIIPRYEFKLIFRH